MTSSVNSPVVCAPSFIVNTLLQHLFPTWLGFFQVSSRNLNKHATLELLVAKVMNGTDNATMTNRQSQSCSYRGSTNTTIAAATAIIPTCKASATVSGNKPILGFSYVCACGCACVRPCVRACTCMYLYVYTCTVYITFAKLNKVCDLQVHYMCERF